MSPEEPGNGSLPYAGHGLGMRLLRAREVLLSEYRPIFRANNLTEQQWRVLRILEAKSPQDATTVSEESLIRLPSLSRILRDLQARGLIERRANRGGASRIELSISSEGRSLILRLAPEIAARMASVHSTLTDDQYGQLLSMLDIIADRGRR